jgi:hypothetical protein
MDADIENIRSLLSSQFPIEWYYGDRPAMCQVIPKLSQDMEDQLMSTPQTRAVLTSHVHCVKLTWASLRLYTVVMRRRK